MSFCLDALQIMMTINDCDYSIGMEIKVMNKFIYVKAAQRINAAMKIVTIAFFSAPIIYLSPFILVTFQWCMGNYTINSWIFYYAVW